MGFFGTIAKIGVGIGKLALGAAGVALPAAKKAAQAVTYVAPEPPPPPPPAIPYALPNFQYVGSGAGGGPVTAYTEQAPLRPVAAASKAHTAPRKAKKAAKKQKKAAKKAGKLKFGSPAWQKKYGSKKKKR